MKISTKPKVAIVVLNWNGWRDTVECLESLTQMNYPNYQVIVVDNGSTDGSTEKIRQWAEGKIPVESKYIKYDPDNKPVSFDETSVPAGDLIDKDARLILLRVKENLGFARGNNVGIRFVLSNLDCEYIMLLNNDTVVRPDFLSPLLDVFDKYPRTGLSGPKIIDYFSGKHVQGIMPGRVNIFTIIIFFTPLKMILSRLPIAKRYLHLLPDSGCIKAYGLAGCCLCFKSKILEEIGMFDETTFLGWEEYIIAEKLLKYGHETYAVPESVIYHKVARDTVKIEPVEKTIIFLKSEKYFLDTYLKMPIYQKLILAMIRSASYSLLYIVNRSFRKNFKELLKAIISSVGRDNKA